MAFITESQITKEIIPCFLLVSSQLHGIRKSTDNSTHLLGNVLYFSINIIQKIFLLVSGCWYIMHVPFQINSHR